MAKSIKVEEMIKHIKTLLESKDNTDLKLAFQLMTHGGVPKNTLTHLLSIAQWHWDKTIQKDAQELINSYAPEKFKKYISKYWKKYYNLEFSEVKISQVFNQLSQISYIDKNVLALMSLKLRKKGGKFCLEETNINPKIVFQELLNSNELYLANFELKTLPKDIGFFTQLTHLNLSGNQFTEVPKEITFLKNLQYISYERTPLSDKSIQLLEKSFPKIFSIKYYNIGCDLKSDEYYLEANKYFIKSAKLDLEFAEAWHNIGASLILAEDKQKAQKPLIRAIQVYNNRISKNPKSAYDWFWKSCVYALLGDKNQAFKDLKTCISLDKSYKYKAKLEEDFEAYYEDAEFKKVVS